MKQILQVFVCAILMLISACASRPTPLEKGMLCFLRQDFHAAFIRLQPLAFKGDPAAQYAVGYMYFYGQGILENKEQALMWFNLAAKQNYPLAIDALNLIVAHQHTYIVSHSP